MIKKRQRALPAMLGFGPSCARRSLISTGARVRPATGNVFCIASPYLPPLVNNLDSLDVMRTF